MEAGLSQGVAVFYFASKTGLLTETMRDMYRSYEENWRGAAAGGLKIRAQLVALITADFDPRVCSPEILSVWFAFWGEQSFTRGIGKSRGLSTPAGPRRSSRPVGRCCPVSHSRR